MIHADLNGKNRVPEDVLTSNCLGLLKLLPDYDLLSFLSAAEDGQQELLSIPDLQVARASLEFWPALHGGGIPDAILTVTAPGSFLKVIIEVKHGAPKSGNGESDQLATYWRAAQSLYPDHCAVVYLTHHRVFPKAEIDESNRVSGHGAKIYWLGWFSLFLWTQMQLSTCGFRSPCEMRIISALHGYLYDKGYRIFTGWKEMMPAFLVPSYDRCYPARILERTFVAYNRQYRMDQGSAASGPYTRAYSVGHLSGGTSLPYTSQQGE